MLPISSYPSIGEDFLPRVEGEFSKPRLKQFARYSTGLIACKNKTVTGINNTFIGRNDQSALDNWLTESDWSEESPDKTRKVLKSFLDLSVKPAPKVKTAGEILRYTLSDIKERKTLYQMETT